MIIHIAAIILLSAGMLGIIFAAYELGKAIKKLKDIIDEINDNGTKNMNI